MSLPPLFLFLLALPFALFSLVQTDAPVVVPFSPPDKAEVAMAHWSNTNVKHVILRTYGNSVYMSTSGGVSWESLAAKIGSSSFQATFMNEDVIVLVGNTNWLLTEFGVKNNFAQININQISSLDFHPTNKQNILIRNNNGQLFLTTNLKDFNLVAESVSSFEWSITTQPDCFFYTTNQADLIRYSLNEKKGTVVKKNTTFVEEKENTLFVTSNGKLFVSQDGLVFSECHFAVSFQALNAYRVLEYSTGTYLISIAEASSSLAYIFKSDSTGTRYSLSFPFVGNTNGRYDLDKVLGMEGIIIANEVANFEEVRTRGIPIKRTRISFNNGLDWSYLPAPTQDHEGRPIICSGACHLHLNSYGAFPRWGPIYSTTNSVGILISTGNIGRYLVEDISEVNTYMSRDAGLTWLQLRKGSSIYEMGDHGGIILMVENTQPTTYVEYSLDEGLHWSQLQFDTRPVLVKNVMIEPTNTGKSFILYGVREEERASITFHLDFSSIHERDCNTNDYEDFSPNDGRAQGKICVLGRQVVYTRKKRDSLCFNARDNRIKYTSNCSCAAEDYECDVGYEKTPENTCIAVGNIGDRVPAVCPEGSSYKLTTGYRKLAGDTCSGDLKDYGAQVSVPCPKGGGTSKSSDSPFPTALVLVVVFLILAIVVTLALLYRNRDKVKALVSRFFVKTTHYHPLNVNGNGNDSLYDPSVEYEEDNRA